MILRSSVARRAVSGLLIAMSAAPAFADDLIHSVPFECHALADSRGLSAALVDTIFGDPQSFEHVQASFVAMNADFGKDTGSPPLRALLASMNKHADQLVQQRELVQQDHDRIRDISRSSSDLLEASATLSLLMLQNGASVVEINAALRLSMLSQQLGRSADTFMGWDGVRPESVFLLGKDLKTFDMIVSGLKNGDTSMGLHARRLPAIQQQLARAITVLAGMKSAADPLLGRLTELMTARLAQTTLQQEADALGHALAMACAGSDGGAANPLRVPVPVDAPATPNKP